MEGLLLELIFRLLFFEFNKLLLEFLHLVLKLLLYSPQLFVFLFAYFKFGFKLLNLILQSGDFLLLNLQLGDLLLQLGLLLVMGTDCFLQFINLILQLFVFSVFLQQFNFHFFSGIYEHVQFSVQFLVEFLFSVQ